MDAIILAAGLGQRLRPYTETTPKPLLPVQGRPLLDWILGALPAEVNRTIVVVNYLAEQIEHYLKTQPYQKQWVTVRQTTPRGTGDALRSCREIVQSERFLVLNGDDLYGAADLAQAVQYPAAILVSPVDQPKQFGIVFPRPDGSLEKLVEKPNLEGRHLANIGAYLFPRVALTFEPPLSPRGEYEITDYVTWVASRQAVQVVTAGFWYPVSTIDAWRKVEQVDLSPCQRSPQ
jgi:bifunctional UDP-N-acetylglucosamine pyrophosphorylase/glucosamine-1-phosphate N-acetyltransferase